MDKKFLKKLKKKLPRKFLTELSRRSEMSKSTVSKTLIGVRDCNKVVEAAIAWAEEIEANNVLMKEKINQL